MNRILCLAMAALFFIPSSARATTDFASAYNGAVASDNGSYIHPVSGDLDAMLAIDGDPTTHWAGLSSQPTQIMTIQFANFVEIDSLVIQENDGNSYFTSATIRGFNGYQWVDLLVETKSGPGMSRSISPIVCDQIQLEIQSVVAPPSWANPVAEISEFQAWGVPWPSSRRVNLTSLGTTSADNGHYDPSQTSDKALDGDPTTLWAGIESAGVQSLTMSFGGYRSVDRIRVLENRFDSYVTEGTVLYHNGYTWLPLVSISKTTANLDVSFGAVVADSIRLDVSAVEAPLSWVNRVALIFEFEVMGDSWPSQNSVSVPPTCFNTWANGTYTGHSPAMAFDGDPATSWAGLESLPQQSVSIGWCSAKEISSVQILETRVGSYFTDGELSYHNGYKWYPLVSISKTSANFNYEFAPVVCDSLRLTIANSVAPTSWANQVALVSEIQVNGAAWPSVDRISLEGLGVTAYADGSYNPSETYPAAAIDGSLQTHWDGLEDLDGQHITLAFPGLYEINRIRILESRLDAYFTEADFEYYDGRTWNPLMSVSKSVAGLDATISPVQCDAIRLNIHAVQVPSTWANKVALIWEFEVMGSKVLVTDTPTVIAADSVVRRVFPNPFNPRTTFALTATDPTSPLTLQVFDVRGRLVRTLIDELRPVGEVEVPWDGLDAKGERVSSGIYMYRAQNGGRSGTGKVVLVK